MYKFCKRETADTTIKSIAEINYEKYNYIHDGIPVIYKNEKRNRK